MDGARVALPLASYFVVMWFLTFFLAYKIRAGYGQVTAVALTAAANDADLAIAMAIVVFWHQVPPKGLSSS